MEPSISHGLSYRSLDQSDGAQVADLIEQSPDTGAIHFSPHYQIDAIEAFNLFQGEYCGIVAELPTEERLVGMCLSRIQDAQFNGSMRTNSYVNSLVVHPAFRKKGIASELVRRIVDYSYDELGKDCVIWAAVQDENIGSERTILKYLEGKLHRRLVTLSLTMRASPPPDNESYTVRPIREEDFPFIIEGMNRFYRSFNFYPPQSVDKLIQWINQSPFADRFRRYRVVQDRSGQVLSGAAISEQFRIREIHLKDMPLIMRLLNTILKYVPPDGNLREVVVDKYWFSRGNSEAARYLLEMIRWEWRQSGSTVLISMDAKSPILEAIRPRAWMPKTVSSLFSNSANSLNPNDMIYF